MKIFKSLSQRIIEGFLYLLPIWVSFAIVIFILSKIASLTMPLLIYLFEYIEIEMPSIVISLISFLLSLFIVYLIGLIGSIYIGNIILSYLDKLFLRIPFVKTLYAGTKQIIDAFTLQRKHFLKEVVIIEYPRKGLYTLGFVTNKTEEVSFVFLPTTPNPTSGWLILLKNEDIVPLDLTTEEAIKLIVSGGIFQSSKTITIKKDDI